MTKSEAFALLTNRGQDYHAVQYLAYYRHFAALRELANQNSSSSEEEHF